MTSKLTALIEAAKAADFDGVQTQAVYEANERFEYIANPATILELCALLEKAEETLVHIIAADYRKWEEPYNTTEEFAPWAKSRAGVALAAIKQWKTG